MSSCCRETAERSLMKVKRRILREMPAPYAVNLHKIGGREKAVFAAELDSLCVGVWADTLEQEVLWEGKGGTMNTFQLNERGDFLAIQRFYRGFQSKDACIVKVENREGKWEQTEIASLPFCHRMCVVEIEDVPHMVCCVLCANKESPDDWSQPGRVAVSKVPLGAGEQASFATILEGLHKNHGIFQGSLDGKETILVTGEEGIFQLKIPESLKEPWSYEKLIARETSDCTVLDVDGDGEDEIIAIEGFHGNRLAVYKRENGRWEQVYTYPIEFGHAIWSGTIFSKPGFLIGYRAANAALLLFQLREKREGRWLMDITVLDEHEGPTNAVVAHGKEKELIFSCSCSRDRILLYELMREKKDESLEN